MYLTDISTYQLSFFMLKTIEGAQGVETVVSVVRIFVGAQLSVVGARAPTMFK